MRDGALPSRSTYQRGGIQVLLLSEEACLPRSFSVGRKFGAVAAVPTTTTSHGISGIMIASRLRMPSYLVGLLV